MKSEKEQDRKSEMYAEKYQESNGQRGKIKSVKILLRITHHNLRHAGGFLFNVVREKQRIITASMSRKFNESNQITDQ